MLIALSIAEVMLPKMDEIGEFSPQKSKTFTNVPEEEDVFSLPLGKYLITVLTKLDSLIPPRQELIELFSVTDFIHDSSRAFWIYSLQFYFSGDYFSFANVIFPLFEQGLSSVKETKMSRAEDHFRSFQ